MPEKHIYVVTVDTASIQRYIFASNKLKENIGASFIIEKLLYADLMIRCLREAVGESRSEQELARDWLEKPETIALESEGRQAEIGYIGGGNAMLLFANKAKAHAFIALFSCRVLQFFPGIQVIFGQGAATTADLKERDRFQVLREGLNKSIRKCRHLHHGMPQLFKPGIVEDCPSSNDAAEFPGGEASGGWISGSTKAKLAAAKLALKHVENHYKAHLGENYTLTNEIEKLGQQIDKGYVSIVHADGNGIGKKFMQVGSLAELRKLSVKVSKIADEVIKDVIAETVRLMELEINIPLRDREFQLETEGGRLILPIRPILAAGDDITFVCEGRLGVHLAAKVLESFEKHRIEDLQVSACAGVSICKTHYPFSKAYHLAEELIDLSKATAKMPENRGEDGEGDQIHSWMHFLPVPEGYSGDLEDVKESQFTVNGRALLSGPFRLKDHPVSYEGLMERLLHYAPTGEGKGWPRSKLMEMRDAFRLDSSSQELFLKEAQARGLEFYQRPPDLLLPPQGNQTGSEAHLIFDTILLADHFPDLLKNPPTIQPS